MISTTVKGGESRSVGGSRTTHVGDSDTRHVGKRSELLVGETTGMVVSDTGTAEVVISTSGASIRLSGEDVTFEAAGSITIKVGQTVRFVKTHDPTEPHTVTFGPESPDPLIQLLPSGGNAYDGTGTTNSGLLSTRRQFAYFQLAGSFPASRLSVVQGGGGAACAGRAADQAAHVRPRASPKVRPRVSRVARVEN